MNTPHILCVGDIISGAFITLHKESEQVVTDDKGYKRLIFEMGAKLPYDKLDIVKAVECAPNAAVALARLGLSVSLMAWLGDDATGREMVEYLKSQSVSTDDLVIESDKKSNYHFYLRYGADRTKLQRFEDYAYQWKKPAQKPDWLYLGVLGEKTEGLHQSILQYLQDNPDIKLAFQPGMYHLIWGAEKMAPFYKRAEIVVTNREEAATITGKDHSDIAGLIQAMHSLGVTTVVITDGPEGAYASDGTRNLFMPIYPDIKEPYDRTGAGDAFASTLTAALAQGKPLDTALTWAPINSMNVSQYIGAQEGLLTQGQIEEFLVKAPAGYKAEPLA